MAGSHVYTVTNPGKKIENTPAGEFGSGGTVADDSVTNAKLANMPTDTIKGRDTAGTGDPEDLTPAQVRTILNVADGASANSTDASLRDRATHTGTQAAATISDFNEAVDDRVGALLVAGTNVTLTYNDGANTLTVDAASGTPGADSITNTHLANMAQATIKGRQSGAGTGDPEDLTAAQARTILNVADGSTANSSDATLLARANHTGTQLASTISDFNEAVDDRVGALVVAGTNVTVTYNDAANTLTIDASTAASGNFTPTGTGAVVRTQDVKMREVELSVLDYGADKTGVADSSTAFANALTAANAGCQRLRIPAGTYRLNSKWLIDKQCHIFGDGRNKTIINTHITTDHAIEVNRDPAYAGATLIRIEDMQIQRAGAAMNADMHGLMVKAKVDMRNVHIRNYTNDGIHYETSTGGVTGAVFFSKMDGVWSKDNGRDGCRVRNGANANLFINCQFDANGSYGFHHVTDGNPTYGNVIIGGQCSYNGSYGYYFESGTDIQAYGLYGERNGCSTPGNESTDYTTTPFDFYIGDNVSRSWINIGTLFGSSTTHVRAPSRGLNDGLAVMQGGRRIYGSTSFMVPTESNAVANVTTANASDLATCISLANSLKTTLNDLLAQLRTGNTIAP